jgi:hypothetical protein
MSFNDKFGITEIVDDLINTLCISWDYDTDIDDISEHKAVLLYDYDDLHHHIELTDDQCLVLHIWLSQYLAHKKKIPGATGRFPHGKVREDDNGELAAALHVDKNMLLIDFGKNVSWLALLTAFTEILNKKAQELK